MVSKRFPLASKWPFLSITHLPVFVWLFLCLFAIRDTFKGERVYKADKVISEDIYDYYGYVTATFIHGDLRLRFLDEGKPVSGTWWQHKSDIGYRYFRFTCGVAILYLPFFLVGHSICLLTDFPADGYSLPYAISLVCAGLFYFCMGLFWLKALLKRHVTPFIASLTLIAVALGTNLLYYGTTEAPMSHVFGFAFCTLFVLKVELFWERPTRHRAFLVGCVFGICMLIRPTHALLVVILLLYGLTHVRDVVKHTKVMLRHYSQLLIFATGALLVVSLQFIYWKYTTGQWLFFAYKGEGFIWDSPPMIVSGLISGRKGWLVYTPILLLSIIGIVMSWFKANRYSFSIPLFLVGSLYVTFSWWCWWYGGSFGMRPLVDFYGLLAIPLALFVSRMFDSNWAAKGAVLSFVCASVYLNIHFTHLYRVGIMHWDSMTYRALWHLRPGNTFDPTVFETLLDPPDYKAALKGER